MRCTGALFFRRINPNIKFIFPKIRERFFGIKGHDKFEKIAEFLMNSDEMQILALREIEELRAMATVCEKDSPEVVAVKKKLIMALEKKRATQIDPYTKESGLVVVDHTHMHVHLKTGQ